ncbi:Coiled-coil domain-containing protein 43 [Halocaridina rubra]|uniref:Coiled-coil domain-containing protein 43 n=1 Tax=Halocaridina rubra TaxID=373956 RepID=A0AAN8X978_HALRR
MAEALPCDFDSWLKDTLVSLNTDDEVFSPYIKGILEGEEKEDDKIEALQGILTEITETGIDELCQDILKKWSLIETGKQTKEKGVEKVELDAKIAKIMEEQAQCVTTTKTISKEQEKLKSAILAQYAQISDGEVSDEEEPVDTGKAFCVKNTNVEDVARTQREKREKDKEEAQKKKEKDKEDRAKQKAREDERKEKEKKRTQKGERRR